MNYDQYNMIYFKLFGIEFEMKLTFVSTRIRQTV